MPRKELRNGKQVADWLEGLGKSIVSPAEIILIGSGALLWHAHERGLQAELPEASMDVDPITDSDEVATFCYNAIIGSDFEREHGWHVNLMPHSVLREFPVNWRQRATQRKYGQLALIVPHPEDLLVPKLKRGEPRDVKHFEWAKRIGLVAGA
jgi:uncharacterized nucleotidyltransferase DUF6036